MESCQCTEKKNKTTNDCLRLCQSLDTWLVCSTSDRNQERGTVISDFKPCPSTQPQINMSNRQQNRRAEVLTAIRRWTNKGCSETAKKKNCGTWFTSPPTHTYTNAHIHTYTSWCWWCHWTAGVGGIPGDDVITFSMGTAVDGVPLVVTSL